MEDKCHHVTSFFWFLRATYIAQQNLSPPVIYQWHMSPKNCYFEFHRSNSLQVCGNQSETEACIQENLNKMDEVYMEFTHSDHFTVNLGANMIAHTSEVGLYIILATLKMWSQTV